jgi:tripartite-type tricarboxylate transporter receptor subunit TctC
MPTLVGYIQSGKLRALGVTTATRSAVFPDLPSIGEFLPGYDASVWFGIAARSQTPPEIVALLNKEINAALNDPAFAARLGDVGGTPLKGSSADFNKLFAGDSKKWSELMTSANIKSE